MSYHVRFILEAKLDIERLYRFLAEKDFNATEKALGVIDQAWSLLEQFPFSCRKADEENPFLREFIITFGKSGYVALFEIEDEETVTVTAVRHLLGEDYH